MKAICSVCKRKKIHYAKGMCPLCYQTKHRYEGRFSNMDKEKLERLKKRYLKEIRIRKMFVESINKELMRKLEK